MRYRSIARANFITSIQNPPGSWPLFVRDNIDNEAGLYRMRPNLSLGFARLAQLLIVAEESKGHRCLTPKRAYGIKSREKA
jgi:hypothetical protein